MTTPLHITGKELARLIAMDLEWVEKNATAEKPVVVTTYAEMTGSDIRSLSPHIHFQGRDSFGNVAHFGECPNLKVAEGIYDGTVDFEASGVESIRNMRVTRPNINGVAAVFNLCKHLKTAEGDFAGFVDFSYSGVEKIGSLRVKPSFKKSTADFSGCHLWDVRETPMESLRSLTRGTIVGDAAKSAIKGELQRRRALKVLKQPDLEL